MPERGPDEHLESRNALPLLTALAMTIAACGASVDKAVNQPQLTTAESHAADNPANAPKPPETTKSPLQQLEDAKRDLEARIIILKREIGKLENLERSKRGLDPGNESMQLMIARKYLSETQEALSMVNTRIGLHRKLDAFMGPEPDDDGSLLNFDADEK